MLADMVSELGGMSIGFEITQAAKEKIIEKAYNPRYGARPIRREIQNCIEDAVATLLLKDEAKSGVTVSADVSSDGSVEVKVK